MRKIEKQTIAALQLYVKELQKLATRYQAKRDKEKSRINAKFGDIEFTRDGLADAYGYGSISRTEYEKALDELEQASDAKNVAEDVKTSTSEVLRMIRSDIRELEYEIQDINNAECQG